MHVVKIVWDEDPDFDDSEVTSDQSHSTPHSVAVLGVDDLVHRHSGATSGVWEYVVRQFVPNDFDGQSFFILLKSPKKPCPAVEKLRIDWLPPENARDRGESPESHRTCSHR